MVTHSLNIYYSGYTGNHNIMTTHILYSSTNKNLIVILSVIPELY